MGEQLEIETKYDVGERIALPALHELPGVVRVAQPEQHDLEAVYFDTEAYDLAAAGITLRRRTGGDDAGWHVKFPVATGERLEVRRPLGRAVRSVPIELVRMVRVHVRDRALAPVVTLRTHRVVHRLVGADDAVLAELSDDQVTAEIAGAEPDVWREWELELVDGERELLAAAEPVLRKAGAEPAAGPSKLARALGDRVPVRAAWELPEKPTAVDVFRAYAAEQVAAIHRRDPEVRRDRPEGVHKLRVATRRLRSALATYRPVIDRVEGDRIRAELKWLAGELGGMRDTEVIRDRLAASVAAEPVELVMGRVAGAIDDHLRATYKAAHKVALETLETERYLRLLDDLDALVADPPLTEAAADLKPKKTPDLVVSLLKHDWKRIRRAVDRMRAAELGANEQSAQSVADAVEVERHEVRKAAKRLRYAGESAAVVLGDKATALAASAEQIQEVLGSYQDTVVARELLRQLAVQVHLDGGNAFTLGRLHALEQVAGEEAVRAFEGVWPLDFPF
ncbi:CYTH and CHAD domain-containing protein [Kribbella sp. NBC_01245]|uniref:CYTH and CHAD domain-containing protein n=1 Tax=Kribbella sp. NBC_01245 TaxID=2903578 RepID=UPI002E2CA968|nr:CYTH and CHAD domain-containing protein [Kribbella sp. NBC_01245]